MEEEKTHFMIEMEAEFNWKWLEIDHNRILSGKEFIT